MSTCAHHSLPRPVPPSSRHGLAFLMTKAAGTLGALRQSQLCQKAVGGERGWSQSSVRPVNQGCGEVPSLHGVVV